RVPDQYVTAIETALGHHLQLVLTEQPQAAQQILAELNTNKKGRASIAPLAWLKQRDLGIQGHEPTDEGTHHGLTGSDDQTPVADPSSSGPAPYLNGAPLAAIAVVESENPV